MSTFLVKAFGKDGESQIMNGNEFYKELDSLLASEMEGIVWARYLKKNEDEMVYGKAEHRTRALQRRQALLHAIYRFGYMTSQSANSLLRHSTRNNTATFLTMMVNEGLLRRYEIGGEYKYVYLIRKPHGLEFLKKTFESMGKDNDFTYEVDASKIGKGESIYHHELITEMAIAHVQKGQQFLLEPEIKAAANQTGFLEHFNPKLSDLILKFVGEGENGESYHYWEAHEFEVSAKSEERVMHMLMKADHLIATNIVAEVTWHSNVESTINLIEQAKMNGYVPKYVKDKFGRFIPRGEPYTLSINHKLERLPDRSPMSAYSKGSKSDLDFLDYSEAL